MSQKGYSRRHLPNSKSLKEHLKFDFPTNLEIGNSSKIHLRILCTYSYPIALGIENITIPILVLPDFEIDYSDKTESRKMDDLKEEVILKIKEWFKSNHILNREGTLELEITYYTSQLTIIGKPFDLIIPISQISDLG